jgi:hypothetical protein
MRNVLGFALGALLLLGLTAAGIGSLQNAVAQGDSLIPAFLMLFVPLLVAGWIVAAVLQAAIAPLKRHRNVAGVIGLAVSVGLGAGIYAMNSDIPLQRPDAAVTAAVSPACAGQAVIAAHQVLTGSHVLNHIVVLDDTGAEFPWTGKPAVDWRPPNVADVELVACVEPQDHLAVVEVCEYNGPSTTRYSARREIRVMAPRTGAELARFSIIHQPESCPPVKSSDMPEIKASVEWRDVEEHLDSLVHTGAFTDPDPIEGPSKTWGPGDSGEPGPTAEPTPEIRELSLAAALDAGLVTVKAVGESLQRLDIELASKTDEPLTVIVPAGTMFVPRRAATQTMIVISSTWVEVPAGEVADAVLDVACAQMHDDQPGETGKADTFTVREKPARGDLARLVASEMFRVADFRVQQFAVWTITNDPTRSGYVRLATFGIGSGPSAAELREIKSMFRDAGIDPGDYRVFR